jgi:hypothetical protein
MLGKFFRISTDHKQRVNKEKNIEIDSPASRGREGKYTNTLASTGLRLRQQCQFSNYVFFFLQNFEKELIETKEIAINAKS